MSKISSYDPLPTNVYIAKSPIHGMGLFARQDIPDDYDFGITHVTNDRFPDGLIRTPFGGFINHSFTPNLKMYKAADTIRTKTIANIKTGEELTVDYRPWYSDESVAKYH